MYILILQSYFQQNNSILYVENDGRFTFLNIDNIIFTKIRKHSTAPKKKIDSSPHSHPKKTKRDYYFRPYPVKKFFPLYSTITKDLSATPRRIPRENDLMFLLVILTSMGNQYQNFTTSVLAVIVTLPAPTSRISRRPWTPSTTMEATAKSSLVITLLTIFTGWFWQQFPSWFYLLKISFITSSYLLFVFGAPLENKINE